MRNLAAVMVPAHGFAVTAGAMAGRGERFALARTQVGLFMRNLIKGCLWASAIAAGALIYTSFVAKWKEKGWPTIPISALVLADQTLGGARQTSIPLSGIGGSTTYSPNGARTTSSSSTSTTTTSPRQTSLLDLDEFQG